MKKELTFQADIETPTCDTCYVVSGDGYAGGFPICIDCLIGRYEDQLNEILDNIFDDEEAESSFDVECDSDGNIERITCIAKSETSIVKESEFKIELSRLDK